MKAKKAYTVDAQSNPVEIKDNKNQILTLQKTIVADSSDTYLRVHSKAKAMKEGAMGSRFSRKFEEGLLKIKTSLSKKSGIKTQAKVWERIGRLKATYPSIHSKYELKLKVEKEKIIALKCEKKKIANNDGYYLLRTTLSEKDEQAQRQKNEMYKFITLLLKFRVVFFTLPSLLYLGYGTELLQPNDLFQLSHTHLNQQ